MAYTEENRICQNCNTSFKIEPDDFSFYEKMDVPAPQNCPLCRQQSRMLFRNFKTLYKRPASKSHKQVISVYNPDVPFPVYEISEWWGDSWDPMEYGIDIDWDLPFFDQITKLFNTVPHISLTNIQSENCEFSSQILKSKNCYLAFGCVESEDCDYGHIVWNSKDSIDNLYLFKCESCYECVDCLVSTQLLHSQECEACIDSIGLFDCRNCLNCIGCVGLVNKSYCIFNKQVTREEYNDFLLKHPLSDKRSIDYILKERDKLRRSIPQRSFFGSHNNNVSGNHIYNSHNIHYSFDVKSGENSKFCYTLRKAIDSYDIGFTVDLAECYQSLTIDKSSKVIGSQQIIDSHDVYYSDSCYNCNDIFGCYGLRKKSYCILNKQYTKEEYQGLFPKLKELMRKHGEWGNFFPKELTPFGYNESIVNEYMPMTKEVALAQGYKWKDNIPSSTGQETISPEDLPANPEDYNSDLAKEILACENCQKNYRLIEREIGFYKRVGLPIPKNCFNCRHARRMSLRNPRILWDFNCNKCNAKIKTSYPPERQGIYKIYCEKCYQQEIY